MVKSTRAVVFSLGKVLMLPDIASGPEAPRAAREVVHVRLMTGLQGVPTNELHACGYVSIGCEPCTRPVLPNQHEREGRWWWEVCVCSAPF